MVPDALSRLPRELIIITEVKIKGILDKSVYYVTLISISDNFKSRLIKAYNRDD